MEDNNGLVKEKSKYNEASLNIMRLHNSWVKIAGFRSNAAYELWKWELDTVWSELCQDVKGERLGDEALEIQNKNELLRKAIGVSSKNRQKLYETLNKRTIFLRRLQDKVGKGGSYDDGTGEDFE